MLLGGAVSGSVRVVSRCLRNGDDIESVTPGGDGETALAVAAVAGHLPVVDLLLSEGASVTSTDSLGRTPLFNAASSPFGRLEIIERLLKAGSSITVGDTFGNNPVHAAAHGGNPLVVRAMLEAGGDVSARNEQRFTPLMTAAQKGHVSLFRWLVKQGFGGVNDTCVNGMSSLFLATDYAGADMVETVIRSGGDVRTRTIDGWTPLHAATRLGNVRMIKALLRAGADPVSRGPSDIAPLYLAAKEGHREAARELVRAGGDPLSVCRDGFSALYNAVVESHPAVAADMLQALERRDEERGTVFPYSGESCVAKAFFGGDRRRMTLVQGAAYGLEAKSLSKLLSMGALDPFSMKGGDGRAAEYVDLVTPGDAGMPPKDPVLKAAMHRMIARRPAFTATSWLWPRVPGVLGGGTVRAGAGAAAGGRPRPRVSVFRPGQGRSRNVRIWKALRRYSNEKGS